MKQVPKHIAIIMDGNRRWAAAQGKDVLYGHRYVADILLEQLVDRAIERGVSYITFWAWSTENWKRSKLEVAGILKLFKSTIKKHFHKLHTKGVRIMTIGNIAAFPKDIYESIQEGVETSKNNTKITAVFALNYGGRDEIVRGVEKLLTRYSSSEQSESRSIHNFSKESSRLRSNSIDEAYFSQLLDTAGIPDPELIIRTGGEQRLSGFLLWQSEYAELYFTPTLMPDFTPDRLDEAIAEFGRRSRRFGK